MPLRALTVRFDETTHRLIREEAERAGVTVGQFIREAAIIRATIRALGAEHAPIDIHLVKHLSDTVVEMARVDGRE